VTEHHLTSGVVAEASGEDVEDERVALRIGEVAKLTGLTTRTLRYWEEVGLITPSGYRDSGERMYSAGDVGRATRIRELQDLLGFSLAEVRIVLDTEDVFDSLRSVIAGNPCDSRLLQMIDDAIVANDRLVSRLDDTLVRIHAFRDERAAKAERLRAGRSALVTRDREAADGEHRTGAAQAKTGAGGGSEIRPRRATRTMPG
jgi:DNA-binding transcriptional MerR regulator